MKLCFIKITAMLILAVFIFIPQTIFAEDGDGDDPVCPGGPGTCVIVGNDIYTLVNTGGGGLEGPVTHSHSDPYYPSPHPQAYDKMGWTPWLRASVFSVNNLLTYEETKDWTCRIKHSGGGKMPDNIVWQGDPRWQNKVLPLNFQDPVNEEPLLTTQISSKAGGVLEATDRIMASWGYYRTRSLRRKIFLRWAPEPGVEGIALGSSGNITKIESSTTGHSFSVSPVLGWSKGYVEWPYEMKAVWYPPGPTWLYDPMLAREVSRDVSARQREEVLANGLIFRIYMNFDEDQIRASEHHKLGPIVRYYLDYREEMARMKHVLIIFGFTDSIGTEPYNWDLGGRRGKNVREAVIAELEKFNISRSESSEKILCGSAGETFADTPQNHDDRNVRVYRASELSKQPKERNTDS